MNSAPIPLGVEAGYIEPGSVFDSDRADEIAAARRAGGGMTLDEMAAEAYREQTGVPRGLLVAVIGLFALVAAGSFVAWGLS